MGTQLPSTQKGDRATNFRPMSIVEMAGWIKMPLGMEVSLGPGLIALDGDPAPSPPKRGHSPQFSAHIYCGQTAGWIKVSLGMEVGLDPSDIVLHGDPGPLSPKGGRIFGPCLPWPNRWMDQDATWYGGRPRPWPHCARWGSSLPQKGYIPQFSAHVHCGQTVAHLSYC